MVKWQVYFLQHCTHVPHLRVGKLLREDLRDMTCQCCEIWSHPVQISSSPWRCPWRTCQSLLFPGCQPVSSRAKTTKRRFVDISRD